MRIQLVLVTIIVGVFVLCQAQDITPFLRDKAYVQKQINCIIGKNECDAIGKQIIGLLPEVLNNGCNRCTPQQATNARKLIEFMQQNYPNEWRIIVQRYTKH